MAPGAIKQLLAIGIQDTYLSIKPEINIFQYVSYRYVNFSTDIHSIPLHDNVSFGGNTFVNIPKYGHLLSKMYLHIQLPALQLPIQSNIPKKYVNWSDTLGYAIFNKPVELLIGGVIVDRLYPICLDMLHELTNNNKLGLNQMILKGDSYRDSMHNAEKPIDLVIPLNFWFTKHYSLALPLVSITNQDIQLNFSFNNFNSLVNYNGLPPSEVSVITSSLICEYLYLDDSIIEKFLTNEHKYVITQMVYNGDDIIPPGKTLYSTNINIKNPCQELLFCCIDQNNLDNNNYFNYSRRSDESPLISQIKLIMDGTNRIEKGYMPEFFFRTFLPNNVHSVIPLKYMYIIPFAIIPEDFTQPTGSANFSRFDEITLQLQLTSNNPQCQLHIYGIMYNIVHIKNGYLTFEWNFI